MPTEMFGPLTLAAAELLRLQIHGFSHISPPGCALASRSWPGRGPGCTGCPAGAAHAATAACGLGSVQRQQRQEQRQQGASGEAQQPRLRNERRAKLMRSEFM